MMSFVNSKIPTVMVPRSQVQKRSKRMETVSICNVKRTVRFRQEAFGKTYQVTYATHWLLCNTSQNEGRAQECAATSLLERMVKDAKDPEYMEDVIRNTLGSMYAGKYHFGFIFFDDLLLINLSKGGADTVRFLSLLKLMNST